VRAGGGDRVGAETKKGVGNECTRH
jgi:hypothetical protein